jgi:nucleotide-binding universal stress UspA family protein
MFHSLLVPLDGSPFGEQALPLALSIARRAGASLELVNVAAPLPLIGPEAPLVLDADLDAQVLSYRRGYLDDVSRRIAGQSSVPVRSSLLEGEVGPTLCHHASSSGADLVVMSTHGRGPLKRFWLGSVADELVRHLTMPLLLVPPGASGPFPTPEPVLRHILLPLDGSPLAEQMIEPAVALGTLMDADFTLLRIVKPILPFPTNLGGSISRQVELLIARTEKIHRELCEEARAYLEKVAQPLRDRGQRVCSRVVAEDQPGSAILHETEAHAIDLIALETHGRRGLARLILGSVADKVVRGASVPVLVHRPRPV